MTFEQFTEAQKLVGMVGDTIGVKHERSIVEEDKTTREVVVTCEFHDKNGDGEVVRERLDTFVIEPTGRRFFSDRVELAVAS